MRLSLLSVLIVVSFSLSAQKRPYVFVDSVMREYKTKIKSEDDLYKVVNYIRNTFQDDSLRLRASFIWVTENIGYDVKAYQQEDMNAAKLGYVIKNKKAVCGGYASLIKFFCSSFNIDCEVVNGYGRAGKSKIVINQTYLRNNHAWNAVKINGTWRLLDATWAAGVVDDSNEDNLVYHKKFNESYYDTPPEKLILNHLPAQKQYQLTNKAMDQKQFMKSPLFFSDYLQHNISAVLPDTALVKAKIGDTLVFRLKTSDIISNFFAYSDHLEKARYETTAIQSNEWVEFRYPVKLSGFYNLYIGCTGTGREKHMLMAYKLDIK